MENSSILNLDNSGWKTGKYPLFLGEELGLHDSMNRPYPELFDLFKKLKSLDWAEDEIKLNQDRMDFESCDKSTYDVMIKTLSWQFEADSLISRSIAALFAPFVSNSDLSQMMLRWSDNEGLHALTYSEIIRQCLSNPDEVFDEIINNKDVTERSGKIVEGLLELKKVGAMYTLDKGSVSPDSCREVILKALVSIYCLEQMEFMASFACTFSLCERQLFLGVGSLVQKIMIDETIHTQMDEAIIDILFKDDDWKIAYENIKGDVQEIVDSVYQQEISWSSYIFSEGRSIVGLNTQLLEEYVQYKSQVVYKKLGLVQPFTDIKVNPLSWMDNWLDIDSSQIAAQEADLNNYRLNSVVDTKENVVFDFGVTREVGVENLYTVYTKDNCPYCVKLKQFMKDKGLFYTEVDVTVDDNKAYLVSKGLKTVPQVFDTFGNYKGDCTSFIDNYLE